MHTVPEVCADSHDAAELYQLGIGVFLAFSLFNSTGMFNTLLLNLGLIKEPVLLLQSSEHVWLTQWL